MMSEKLQNKYRWIKNHLPNANEKRLILLTGARQTGKTTIVNNFYQNLRYINLDAPENRFAVKNINSNNWHRDIGAAILDEAQKEPSVFEKVKFAFDSGKISFSVLLGSAQILLLQRVRESLAGRIFIFELWPLMLSELLSKNIETPYKAPLLEVLLHDNINKVLSSIPSVLLPDEEVKIKDKENYLLKWGGMPALLYLNDSDKMLWLKSYEFTYLERDLKDLANIKDLEPFRKFQKLTAMRSAKLLNFSELAKDAGISVDSAKRYLEYLNISYQTILLQPYYENLTSSVIKSPKIYFADIGILRQIAGVWGEATGELYENYVVSEIFKWIKTNQKSIEIYFYRTRSGLETDLLLKTEKGFIGIEIKSSTKITQSDCRPLNLIAEKLGKKWLGGLCIYKGEKIVRISDKNVWAVPSYRLFS